MEGSQWKGEGDAFKKATARVRATLIAYWKEDAQEPWFLLTDLPPGAVDPAW